MNKICRGLGLLTAGMLLAILPACRQMPQPPSLPIYDAYREQYDRLPGFLSLSEEQKQNYDAVFTAVTELSDRDTVLRDGDESGTESLGLRVELPQKLADGQAVDTLFEAFLTDNPQFFYIGSSYTYEGYRVGNRAQYTVLSLTLTMNAAERRLAEAKLEQAAKELTIGLYDQEPFWQEWLLHDRLIDRCRYDKAAAESQAPDREYPHSFTAYGALVEEKAVCEGYARAFQLLCRRVGIPCTTVNGIDTATNTAHMWNLVTLGGESYHVDVTWDDREDTAIHVYLNLTTEEISRTHRLDADSPGKDCTATEAGFYRATGRYQERYDRAAIAAAVAKAVQDGDTVAELQFPPEKLPSVGLFVKNRTWFSEAVNSRLPEGTSLWAYDFQLSAPYGVLILTKRE